MGRCEVASVLKDHRKCQKCRKKCCPILTSHMSGSPILQNGKLVGAVTHVLVGDAARGYGIFIENMLDAAGLPAAE